MIASAVRAAFTTLALAGLLGLAFPTKGLGPSSLALPAAVITIPQAQTGAGAEFTILAAEKAGTKTNQSFKVPVREGNAPPTVQAQNQQAPQGDPIKVPVRVEDPETPARDLTLTLETDDPDVIILRDEAGKEYRITFTPKKTGATVFTVRVNDPEHAEPLGTLVLHVDKSAEPPGRPALFIRDGFVFENLTMGQPTAELVFSVQLNKPSTETVTVWAETFSDPDIGNQATPGRDYHSTHEKLIFPPGQTEKYLRVPVRPDLIPEGEFQHLRGLGDEFFEMVKAMIHDPVNADIIPAPGKDMRGRPYVVTEATGYIIDDDASWHASPGRRVESACPDLKVEVLRIDGNAEVRIRPAPAGDPCVVLLDLVGDGSVEIRLEQGGRKFRATLQSPGVYRARPG